MPTLGGRGWELAPTVRKRLAGVSYQTVSRVLNDHPSIRPATRDQVVSAIAELGYRPNPAARALVTSRSRTIGVLSSQTSQYGPATSIAAIELAARDAGYRSSVTTIATTDVTSIRAALDYLLSQSIEALVVIAPQQRVLDVITDSPSQRTKKRSRYPGVVECSHSPNPVSVATHSRATPVRPDSSQAGRGPV